MMTVDMIPNISINILSSVKSNKVLNTTPAKTNLAMSMKKSPSFSLVDIVSDFPKFLIIFDFDYLISKRKYRLSFMDIQIKKADFKNIPPSLNVLYYFL